ncbi:methyltransferase, TIGR04325 family [Pedobacter sp. PLR]|uniref:methyltransferase, TIGR04325 family n=1 Tax=Pedobacter sp. PLR TaxID=2994465 RepID=UPI002245FF9E|nr:methyltransferase, TIGR04325 family [Pedobacter sp. PLR]MCX2449850.1 methyltransferase, TIGR04325 family [Pedobacter sp. PLR]
MFYLVKEFIPPLAHSLKWYSFKYGWKGDYKDYETAKEKCQGYDEADILNKIKESTLKVKNKEIPYERDGIAYDKVQMNFPLLSVLLYVASKNDNQLTLIDFGGSLGTTYYQNLPYLKHLKKLKWCIIEQPEFVKAGKEGFENEHVTFYNSIAECMAVNEVDLFLICNVLQYLEKPYELLEEVKNSSIPHVLLDFIGYNDQPGDRITIQHVPPVFYGIEASYPCYFPDRNRVEGSLQTAYEKKYDFISAPEKYYLQLKPFRYEGSFWEI